MQIIELNELLHKLDINPQALSKKQYEVIEEIYKELTDYISAKEDLWKKMQEIKFNTVKVSEKTSVSRQTILSNPNLSKVMEACIDLSEEIDQKLLPYNLVDKERYSKLIEENKAIQAHIIDQQLLKDETKQLIGIVSDKNVQIEELNKRNNKLLSENRDLRKRSLS